MKNKLQIKNLLIAVVGLLGVFCTANAQSYGDATGHKLDTYVINSDRSNHRGEFRMQTGQKSFTFSHLNNRLGLFYQSSYTGWQHRGSEIFAIGTNGNVGIGSGSNLSSRLNIVVPDNKSANPSDNGIMVYNNGSSGSNDDAIIAARVNGAGSGNPFFSMDVKGVSGWSMGMDNSDGDKFKIANSWSKLSTKTYMTIDNTGNVGIGTTNPTEMLQVIGNTITNNTFLGDVGFGTNWAGFAHKSQVDKTSYSIITDQEGNYTLINKKNTGGGYIGFRIGNSVDKMVIHNNGNVGVGTLNPTEKLDVVGNVRVNNGNVLIGQSQLSSSTDAENTMLTVTGGVKTDKVVLNIGSFPDYVFASDYQLMPIEEVAAYISENKHLPNIPSEKEMVATGLDVTAISVKLVEKIEELTLYTIAQQETNTAQQELIKQQQIMITKLAERLEKLENK